MIIPPLPPLKKGGWGGFFLLLASCLPAIGLVAGFLLLSSCSLRKPATAITADTLIRGMTAVETEEDVFVARESALPLIKILDVLHYGDPKNKKFLGLLAKAYGNYAFGFAELEGMKSQSGENPPQPPFTRHYCAGGQGKGGSFEVFPPLKKGGEGGFDEWQLRAKRFYLKGRDFGISALSTGKRSIADVPLDKFEKYLHKFGKKDVSALFWTAFNWGSYINMSRDDIIAAADLPRVEAIVDRVLELESDFQCGIANAFKGVLISGNPLRGKPELALPYFQKAIAECNGNYLMTRVMYAEWYARAVGDKKLFKETLEYVIYADAALLPMHRLANELAKERAILLLKHETGGMKHD